MDIQNLVGVTLSWREVGSPETAASFHGNVLGYSGRTRATLHAIRGWHPTERIPHEGQEEPPSWDVVARCGFSSYVSAHPYSTGTFSQDPVTCGKCQYLLERDAKRARVPGSPVTP